MVNARLYIIQVLGILLLLCGYFLSDQPDRLSVMHFDPNPACPLVFTNASKTVSNYCSAQTISTSQNSPTRKTNVPKYISFELIMPSAGGYRFQEIKQTVYSISLPENYGYLFFEEINPPPPKSC